MEFITHRNPSTIRNGWGGNTNLRTRILLPPFLRCVAKSHKIQGVIMKIQNVSLLVL